jgi:hypothetical protein
VHSLSAAAPKWDPEASLMKPPKCPAPFPSEGNAKGSARQCLSPASSRVNSVVELLGWAGGGRESLPACGFARIISISSPRKVFWNALASAGVRSHLRDATLNSRFAPFRSPTIGCLDARRVWHPALPASRGCPGFPAWSRNLFPALQRRERNATRTNERRDRQI